MANSIWVSGKDNEGNDFEAELKPHVGARMTLDDIKATFERLGCTEVRVATTKRGLAAIPQEAPHA